MFREDDGDTERDHEDDPFSFFNPGPSSRHHPQHGNAEDDPTLTISFPVMEDDSGEDIIDLKTPLPYVTVWPKFFYFLFNFSHYLPALDIFSSAQAFYPLIQNFFHEKLVHRMKKIMQEEGDEPVPLIVSFVSCFGSHLISRIILSSNKFSFHNSLI